MKKELLLGIFILMFLINFVSAQCIVPYDDMIIIEDTTFCEGEYYFPNGIRVTSNVILDCNNSKLVGNRTLSFYNSGIHAGYYNVIKNCIVENYTHGYFGGNNNAFYNNIAFNNIWYGFRFHNDNRFIGNTAINNSFAGFSSSHSNNNYLENNTASGIKQKTGFNFWYSSNNHMINNPVIENRVYGIDINVEANNNTLTKNVIKQKLGYAIHVSGSHNFGNRIWDNEIYGGMIIDSNTSNNIYCINCVGNRYYDGAIGPTCPLTCLDEDNDGVPNDEDKCPDTEEEQIVYGCSCEQILELKPGKDKSSNCSPGIIKVFTKGLGWAKDLSSNQFPNLGLVSYYDFEDNVEDSMGENHGTNYGANFVEGKIGKALGFDGNGDYVNILDDDSLDLNEFTLSVWFKADSLTEDEGYIINKGYNAYWPADDDISYRIYLTDVLLTGDSWTENGRQFSVYNGWPKNQWNHAVLIYNGSKQKLYLNGNKVDENDQTGTTLINSWNLTIGTRFFDGNFADYYSGLIDEFGIWNRALTQEEVEQLWNNGEGI